MLITFSKPHNFEGKEFKQFDLDLDGLSGKDISEEFRRYSAAGNFSAVVSTDPNFTMRLAARASELPYEFFDQLGAKDFMHVHQAVQNFLLSSDSENQSTTGKSEEPALSSEKQQKQG